MPLKGLCWGKAGGNPIFLRTCSDCMYGTDHCLTRHVLADEVVTEPVVTDEVLTDRVKHCRTPQGTKNKKEKQ